VLAGFLVPPAEQRKFNRFLATTGYHWRVVDDAACNQFLGVADLPAPKTRCARDTAHLT
jgi:hypothetical protein